MIEITTCLALNNEPINAGMEPSLKIKNGLDELVIRKIGFRKLSCEKLFESRLCQDEFFRLKEQVNFPALNHVRLKKLRIEKQNVKALFDPELSEWEFAFTYEINSIF